MITHTFMSGGWRQRERGFALITALLMLVILTLLGVSMMSGVDIQQKMSGNTREKTRAFDAAQGALTAAQNFLGSQVTPPNGVPCSQTNGAPTPWGTTAQVCNSTLTTPTDDSTWPGYVTYSPPGMAVNANGGKDVYAAAPRYYIADLSGSGTNPHYYRITAWALGGNANAVVVVQSVVVLSGSGGGNTPAASLTGQ